MNQRRVVVAVVFVVTCVLAFGATYVLLKSIAVGTAVVGMVAGATLFFVEPYAGLVNYLLFLYVRPQDFVPGMLGVPIMLIIGAATFGLMILHMAVQTRQIRLANAPQNLFMLWLYLAIVLSRVAALYLPAIPEAAIDFMSTMLMYLLIANLVTTQKRLGGVVYLLLGLTMTLAIQGIVQYYSGTGFGGQETYEGRIQGVGIFSDPNDLGLAIVMVLPFPLLKLLERAPAWEKIVSLGVVVLLTYALYLTQSRGGIMAYGALMMLLFSRRFGKLFGYGLGGLAMLALFVIGPRMSTISTGEASAYGRIQAWGIGIDLFEAYPLLGVGYNNFTHYHFRTAHNSFVLCAAELGLIGLYAWVALIYFSIRNSAFIARRYREKGRHRMATYVDGVQFALIAYCLGAFWLSRTYSEVLYIMVGLSTAITQMFIASTDERYVLIERKDFVYILLCVVGGWAFTKGFLYVAW